MMWDKAVEFLEDRVSDMERATHLKRSSVSVLHDDNGIAMSPCTTQLWARDVGIEHDEWTCYFRHWFKKIDGKLVAMKFSHLALMPLVRSCVWQALLYEHVTGRLCGRHAVRLRVEDELTFHSNCSDRMTVKRIGMLAQDMFNIVKNNLNASSDRLSRSGLAMAEQMVINMNGLDYRNARRGWSNRILRRDIVQRIAATRIWDIPTRTEQEAFIGKRLSSFTRLKGTAVKDIIRTLSTIYDRETGECLLKSWSKEELAVIRKEARTKGTHEQVMTRFAEIQAKIEHGIPLTGSERRFKCYHKELFVSVTNESTICNRKQSIQNAVSFVTPASNAKIADLESREARLNASKRQARNRQKPAKTKYFALERRKRTSVSCVNGGNE
jgi:hypothetical protein